MKRRRSVCDCLRLAIERLWSGRIELLEQDGVRGQIVFVNGRIAWATARGQKETLGAFLWRLGRVTREQLGLIQAEFKESGGKKRLGALLEGAGYMTRPMLRRALLLHTRAALQTLVQQKKIEGTMHGGNFAADESILFGPEEVLPDDWQDEVIDEWFRSDTTQVRRWNAWSDENAVLEGVSDIPGYSASAVVASEGDVLCAHSRSGDVDMRMLAISIAATIEAATRAMRYTVLDPVHILCLDTPGGGISVRWVDDERRYLLLVVTEDGCNPSLTRYAVKNAVPEVRNWIAKREAPTRTATNAPKIPTTLAGSDESFTSVFASVASRPLGGASNESGGASDPFESAPRISTGDVFSTVRPDDREQ